MGHPKNNSLGKTMSYLKVSEIYRNTKAVRAVRAAIGKNPILVNIPCHRVIGSNANLVGFASGLDKKMATPKGRLWGSKRV
jgi:methylated-DNA-[protein]-cysteine S-methyltransferase